MSLATQLRARFNANRRFNRDVLWNVGSLAILASSGIAVNLVIAVLRGPETLGVFNQVFAFYIILSQIAVGGLQFSVLQKVSCHRGDDSACVTIVTSAMFLVGIVAAAICTATFLASGFAGRLLDSPAVATGIRWMVPGLFFYSLNKVLLNAVNGMRHMRVFAVLQSARYVLLVTAITGLLLAGCPAARLPAALTIAEFLLFIGLLGYVQQRLFPLGIRRGLLSTARDHLSYGARGALSGILHEVNTRVDILMLGCFVSDATVGVYSFAAILAEGLAQLPLAVRTNVDPIVGQLFACGRLREINRFAKRIRSFFVPAMLALGMLSIALYPVVLRVLFPASEFTASWYVFAILAIGISVNCGYRPFLGILLVGNRPGMHTLLVGCVVLGNITLNVILIPRLGIYGAAAATSVAYLLEAVLLVCFARITLGVRLFGSEAAR